VKPNLNKTSTYIGIVGLVLVIIFVVFIVALRLTDSINDVLINIFGLFLLVILLWSIVSFISVLRASFNLRILKANYEDKEIIEEHYINNKQILRTGIRINTIFLITVIIGFSLILKLLIEATSSI
jgi:hypothetical protein